LTEPVATGAPTRRGAALHQLRHHPAPRFLVAGVATFVVDIGSLRVLHGSIGIALLPATAMAFAIAFFVNFTAARQWAFASTARGGDTRRQLMRYFVLVGLNLLSTLVIVVGLSAGGLNYLWAKAVAAGVNAIANFFVYRHWVFAAPMDRDYTPETANKGENGLIHSQHDRLEPKLDRRLDVSENDPEAESRIGTPVRQPQVSFTSIYKKLSGSSGRHNPKNLPKREENLPRPEESQELAPQRRSWGSWGPEVLVLLAVLFNLWVLRAERLVIAYPNDSSVHMQMVTVSQHLLSTGQSPLDHWYPYLSLGSPYFVQYQSASAILTGALGQVVGPQQAFAWTLYLLLSLWPLCIYWSGRLLGWNRWASAASAAISPLLSSITGYGYEDQSYIAIGNGLWSQLWAMWTLPLAWGFSWRFVSQRRYLYGAVVTLALTIAFHFLTAFLAGLSLVVWVLLRPRDIIRRLGRAWLIGVGAVAATLWVTLPLLVDSKWVSVNEFQIGTFWDDSYGARKILGWLVTGRIYDNGRFPIVTLLVGIGLIVCLARFRNDERARAIVGVWVLSLLLYFGRPTLGPVLNLLPGNGNLLFQRYIMGVQLAGIFLAGVAVVSLARLAEIVVRRLVHAMVDRMSARPLIVALRAPIAILVVIAALTPAWSAVASHDSASAAWIHNQQYADETQGVQLNDLVAVAQDRGGGRIYAGLPTNWGYDFTVGGVPVYVYLADSGVDAVGFTLRTTSLMTDPEAYFDESNLGDYSTFGVSYLILPQGHAPPVPAQLIKQSGPYLLWAVDSSGLIQVVDTESSIVANGSDLGSQTVSFLDSALPGQAIYPTIAYAGQPAAAPTLPSGTLARGPAGSVLGEHDDLADGRAVATIFANRTAVVLLKSSFDPGWSVTVDGQPATVEMVAPALVGVTVSPGKHTVAFQFNGYSSYPLLFGTGFLTLMLFGVGPTFWRRFARRSRHDPVRGDAET
jgi:putative flippase GtrA